MDVIPVLDLMGGRVVHARGGRREAYAPLISHLCDSPEPVAVLDALLAIHPFRRVYLADLDAIMGKGRHDVQIARLTRRFPGLEFWVDSGAHMALPGVRTVWGSETLDAAWRDALSCAPRSVLSLDFTAEGLIGPQDVLASPGAWPEEVIVMTLACVGQGAGPDFARLEMCRRLAPRARLIAAGGVRGVEDLNELARRGVSGALVASALHSGALTGGELSRRA